MMENLEENFRKEKEQVTKLQVKLESAQERWVNFSIQRIWREDYSIHLCISSYSVWSD